MISIKDNAAVITNMLRKAIDESNVGSTSISNVAVGSTLELAEVETSRPGNTRITEASPMFHLRTLGGKGKFPVSAIGMPALRCVKHDSPLATITPEAFAAKYPTSQDYASDTQIDYLKNLVDELDGKIDVTNMRLKCIGKSPKTTEQGGKEHAMLPRFYNGSRAYYAALEKGENAITAISDLYATGRVPSAQGMTIASHPANFAWVPVFAVNF